MGVMHLGKAWHWSKRKNPNKAQHALPEPWRAFGLVRCYSDAGFRFQVLDSPERLTFVSVPVFISQRVR